MAVYIKDNAFVLDTFNQIYKTSIEETDKVIVLSNSFKRKPVLNKCYFISNDLFIEDKNGDWKCVSIHYRKNENKKWWQFWVDDKIETQISMLKIK